MADAYRFAWVLLLIAGVAVVALVSNRITARVRIPVPALLPVVAAVAVKVIPDLHTPPERTVDRLVTAALVFILFDGGIHIGWPRFRRPALVLGDAGIAEQLKAVFERPVSA